MRTSSVTSVPPQNPRLLAVMVPVSDVDRLTVPIYHKLTLSIAEASAMSGISRPRLRQAVKEGKLTTQVIGRGYRVKRIDLETYVGNL